MIEKPDLLDQVDAGEITVRQAGKNAGFIKESSGTYFARLLNFKHLDEHKQLEIMNVLLDQMADTARQEFFAAHQEPGSHGS